MCIAFLKSSVGRKAVMALTGLALYLFVIIHMMGNLQIFLGREALNSYAEHLEELPMLLWPARVVLLSLLLLHMHTAISLALENRRARPVRYIHEDTVQATVLSRTMVLSGLLIFFFIVYHLLHFTFGVTHPQYFHLVDPKGRHDVYSMVILSFREGRVSVSYIAAMMVLSAHLGHGGASLFQSLGFNDEKKMPVVTAVSQWLAAALFIGNSAIPVASFMGWLQPVLGGR